MHPLSWLLTLVLALACACDATHLEGEASSEGETPSWLFVVNADQATLTSDSLLLSGVASTVIAFTDRPDRGFATITMEKLAALWTEGSDSFEEDPPNAAVDGTITDEDGSTSRCTVEVELRAVPVAAEAGEWIWHTVELNRWPGCPQEAELVMEGPSILIDPFHVGHTVDGSSVGDQGCYGTPDASDPFSPSFAMCADCESTADWELLNGAPPINALCGYGCPAPPSDLPDGLGQPGTCGDIRPSGELPSPLPLARGQTSIYDAKGDLSWQPCMTMSYGECCESIGESPDAPLNGCPCGQFLCDPIE
jgi:hypothetical protein